MCVCVCVLERRKRRKRRREGEEQGVVEGGMVRGSRKTKEEKECVRQGRENHEVRRTEEGNKPLGFNTGNANIPSSCPEEEKTMCHTVLL